MRYRSSMTGERPWKELKDPDKVDRFVRQGENEYSEMYDSRNPGACYASAKDSFHEAIRLCLKLGWKKRAADLEKRLEHIKSVFRSQFS